MTEFTAGITNPMLANITAGPDGNLWFTENSIPGQGTIGRITPAGVVTEFVVGDENVNINNLAAGPDGNIWFTETDFSQPNNNWVGRITPTGNITRFTLGSSHLPWSHHGWLRRQPVVHRIQ